MELQNTFLRAILATVARQTFSPDRIIEIMGAAAGEKQHRAFNLCDGTRTQADIAKELGLDQSNFSKTISRSSCKSYPETTADQRSCSQRPKSR